MRAFEAEHDIHLPEDYRAFLRCIGNGGAGPYYGMLPLKEWDLAHWETSPDFLKSPCPLPGRLSEVSVEHERLSTSHTSVGDDWKQYLPPYEIDPYQGTITICHQGCTYYALLIVSGTAKGRVVYMDEDGQPPYFVENPDFLSWYERWLDETLAGYKLSWFGFGMPGSESDLVDVLRNPATPPRRRADALSALRRLPGLSASTIQVVRGSLTHTEPKLRVAAATTVGTFAISEAVDTIRALLSDVQPDVRRAAVDALLRLPDVDWQQDVRAMLRDPDPDVAKKALMALAQARTLAVEDALPLIQAENSMLRGQAIWALGKMGTNNAQVWLVQALADPNRWVRIYAVQALRRLRSQEAVPSLSAMLGAEPDGTVLVNVIGALAESGDTRAVPALIDATRHANAFVRHDAARALGELGDRRAIPVLEALLSDTVRPEERDEHGGSVSSIYRVCDQARQALRKLQV